MPVFPVDLTISHFLQRIQPAWLTAKMIVITNILSPEVMLVVGVLLVWYFWMHRKHPTSTLTAAALLAGNGLTYVLKYLVARPRPTAAQVHVLIHETGYSFPSGHSVGIVLLLAAWYALTPKKMRPEVLSLATIVALLVGVSRIYLGVHWATDVLGGYTLGLLWAGLVFWFARQHRSR